MVYSNPTITGYAVTSTRNYLILNGSVLIEVTNGLDELNKGCEYMYETLSRLVASYEYTVDCQFVIECVIETQRKYVIQFVCGLQVEVTSEAISILEGIYQFKPFMSGLGHEFFTLEKK